MELSTHQYLTFLQAKQVLGSGFRYLRLEEIYCSQFVWAIASQLNLFGSRALSKVRLNFDGRPLSHYKNCFL